MAVQLAGGVDAPAPHGMVQVEVETVTVVQPVEIAEAHTAELEYRTAQTDFPGFLAAPCNKCITNLLRISRQHA